MRYSISFRCEGGEFDIDELATALGIAPRYRRRAGDEMRSRNGDFIETWPRTFASFGLHDDDIVEDEMVKDEFVATLSNFVSRVEKAAALVGGVVDSGGQLDFYIVFFCEGSEGATFAWPLLERLGRLRAHIRMTCARAIPEVLDWGSCAG